mmetsp:Transcript_5177/g.15831  ORF Transcript_5177/g.15831 Transcript_5177/m.15831 type:complete len:671 (-) Transcript_5177:136-2148(-)
MLAHGHIVAVAGFLLVRLDTANVVGSALAECLGELGDAVLDLEAGCGRALLGVGHVLGKERAHQIAAAQLTELNQIVEEGVLVLVAEADRVVGHVTGVVLDGEVALSLWHEMVVAAQHLTALGVELVIAGFGEVDHVVEEGEHSGRALALDEIAADLVVEELDRLPLDLLASVLVLLLLQGEVDEDLLQLLVNVVDTQLLKAVVLKDLETVDVQHTHGGEVLLLCEQVVVDATHNVVEQTAVERLGERVTTVGRIVRVQRHRVDRSTGAATGDGARGQRSQCSRLVDLEDVAELLERVRILHHGLIGGVVLELHVAHEEDGHHDLPDRCLLGERHAHGVHGFERFAVLLAVVLVRHVEAVTLREIPEHVRGEATLQTERLHQRLVHALHHLVEDMKVALTVLLIHDAALLQQVVGDLATLRVTATIEEDLHVLAETRRVVVADRFRVTESLQQRVTLQNGVLHGRHIGAGAGDARNVLHDGLGGLGLAGTGLTRDDHALILRLRLHVAMHDLGHHVHVGLQFVRIFSTVLEECTLLVEAGDHAERVHTDQYLADVGVDEVARIAALQVVHDGVLGHRLQHDHVLYTLVLLALDRAGGLLVTGHTVGTANHRNALLTDRLRTRETHLFGKLHLLGHTFLAEDVTTKVAMKFAVEKRETFAAALALLHQAIW